MSRWADKANALWSAWIKVTGSPPPNLNALYLGLAQAQFETQCGDAWPMSNNWGACDLRSLTQPEKDAMAAGTLKHGWWLYSDGTWGAAHRPDAKGLLQGDSDPNSGAFHVWFGAFPDAVSGAAYYLRYGRKPCLDDPSCTPTAFATALYLACYFGGFHAGARPCGKRSIPLNAAEQANVDSYAKSLTDRLAVIVPALADWIPPGGVPAKADAPPAVAVIDLPSEHLDEAGEFIAPVDLSPATASD